MPPKKDKLNSKIDFTVFSEKSEFNGFLEFKKPLKICGKFEGEINGSALLLVDKNAEVKAHVDVPFLIVFGKIIGNIVASEKVELREGASVVGNIRTPNLEVADGVVFEGQCEMKQVARVES